MGLLAFATSAMVIKSNEFTSAMHICNPCFLQLIPPFFGISGYDHTPHLKVHSIIDIIAPYTEPMITLHMQVQHDVGYIMQTTTHMTVSTNTL